VARGGRDGLEADGRLVAMNKHREQGGSRTSRARRARRAKGRYERFFWPRVKYDEDAEAASYAARIAAAL